MMELLELIKNSVQKKLQDEAKIVPHRTNWASVLGSPCLRQQVYYRLDWDKQVAPTPYLQGLFNTGNLVEQIVKNTLNEIGILSQPRWEVCRLPEKLNDKILEELQISGVTDLFLITYTQQGKAEIQGVIEIKSVDPNIFQTINSLKDFNRFWWMRRYLGQLTIYEFGANVEQGFFLLVNKTNWWDYKWLPHKFDYEYCQKLLDTAQKINNFVQKKIYPDKNITDECAYCPFKHICLPDETSEMVDIKNPELLELLNKRQFYEDSAKEFEQINKILYEKYWHNMAVGTYLVGSYQIIIEEMRRTNYNVPKEIKEQYQVTKTFKKAIITNFNEKTNK